MTRKLLVGVVIGLIIFFAYGAANATIISYDFEAEVTYVGSGVSSEFLVGESVNISFSFDDSSSGTSFGQATYYPIISMSWNIGDYSGLITEGIFPVTAVWVNNDDPLHAGADYFGIGSNNNVSGATVNGLSPVNVRFQLQDPTGAAVDNEILPTSIDLDSWDLENTNLTYFALTFGTDPGITNQVRAQIGSAPVPEPSTLFLLGSGIMGIIGATRRKFKK